MADLAQVEQVWPQWREKFGLPFGKWATGYGQGPKDVAAVRVSGDLLSGYHQAVHDLTLRYLDGITAEELDRIVDTRWDPPVTASVRLVSVIGDTTQHAGQAAPRTRPRAAAGPRLASTRRRRSVVRADQVCGGLVHASGQATANTTLGSGG